MKKSYNNEDIDQKFWGSFFKRIEQVSGPTLIKGWINSFFAYNGHPSQSQTKSLKQLKRGAERINSYPPHLTKVDWTWNLFGVEHQMQFIGGITGVEFFNNHYLRPKLGLAVIEKGMDNILDVMKKSKIEDKELASMLWDYTFKSKNSVQKSSARKAIKNHLTQGQLEAFLGVVTEKISQMKDKYDILHVFYTISVIDYIEDKSHYVYETILKWSKKRLKIIKPESYELNGHLKIIGQENLFDEELGSILNRFLQNPEKVDFRLYDDFLNIFIKNNALNKTHVPFLTYNIWHNDNYTSTRANAFNELLKLEDSFYEKIVLKLILSKNNDSIPYDGLQNEIFRFLAAKHLQKKQPSRHSP